MKKKSVFTNTVICRRCGWVHFAVSLVHAEKEVKEFNDYYDTLTAEQQESYYGSKKSHLVNYLFCMFCNSLYTNFRKTKRGEVPNGSTINPILDLRNDGRK